MGLESNQNLIVIRRSIIPKCYFSWNYKHSNRTKKDAVRWRLALKDKLSIFRWILLKFVWKWIYKIQKEKQSFQGDEAYARA